MDFSRAIRIAAVGAVITAGAHAAETSRPASAPAAAANESDPLYEAGRQLFEQLAPPEVKAEYEFPSPQQWNAFGSRLQQALDGDSLTALAEYAPQARALLTTLRGLGADEDLADWLEQRLDELEGAQQAGAAPTVTPPPVAPSLAPRPRPAAPTKAAPSVPYLDLWEARVRGRPVPARAAALMPRLRDAFKAEGVPPALAWLAEAESSLSPTARSPAGARGLFQLMPETARRLGLSTFLPDERGDPEKSARAAARYLRELHGRFGEWPLALAAYNAGEGRVGRALAARKAKTFAAVADSLPAETRMYVPKVCALVALRTGVVVTQL